MKILEISKALILRYEKKINFKNSDYIFLFSLIWFFIPVFFQNYISLVSSINYSWMLLILVFYLYKIEKITPKKQIFFSFIIGRWRDLGTFVMIGIYAFSVIDAYVDASLSEFDIGERYV